MSVGSRHDPLVSRRRHPVEILNFSDDHSRLCVASRALPVTKATVVAETFLYAVRPLGQPRGG